MMCCPTGWSSTCGLMRAARDSSSSFDRGSGLRHRPRRRWFTTTTTLKRGRWSLRPGSSCDKTGAVGFIGPFHTPSTLTSTAPQVSLADHQVLLRSDATMTDYKSLRLERNEGVVEIVLIGPGKGNAMGPDFWREMPEVFAALDLAAMMGDLGRHFGAGENLAAERTRLLDLVSDMQKAFDNVAACRKPVIAAVSGWCIGGGLDLIAACDLRLCSADARFSLREVKVAIVADLGSLQRLPRIIGDGNTRELAFTGKDIAASRALNIGLVSEVYETRDAVLEAARKLAREIADNPPLVVQGIKRVMNYCADKSVADGLGYVAVWNSAFLQSIDLAEAMAAFRERRAPQFKGE